MLVIPAAQPPETGVAIILHGWGANSRDVEPLTGALRMPTLRYLIPEGRFEVPGTGGQERGWYTFPLTERSNEERLESRQELFGILDNLGHEGTPPDKVVLMGFSQGGSMSLDVALNYHPGREPSGPENPVAPGEQRVAGVISLSGFLLDSDSLEHRGSLPAGIPVFAGHGTLDPIVPLEQGKATIMTLADLGFEVEWHEYTAGHHVVAEEVEDVRRFLKQVLYGPGDVH
ncbi:MAG: alpha/beta hydrolase [Fidelibacterota bacterium]